MAAKKTGDIPGFDNQTAVTPNFYGSNNAYMQSLKHSLGSSEDNNQLQL